MSTELNARYYYTPSPLYVCCFWIIYLDTGVQPQLNQPCVCEAVQGVPFDQMGLLFELQILMLMQYNVDPSFFVHRFTTGLVSSDSNITHTRSDISLTSLNATSLNATSLNTTSLNATRIKSDKADEHLPKKNEILHRDKLNVTNYKSGIRNPDRYLMRKYRVPQRHNFNVASGDILVFHHIQKTGK